MQRRRKLLGLIGLTGLVVASCGGGDPSESFIERQIEEAAGDADVDIDFDDDGNIVIESDEGRVEINTDEDGSVSIEADGSDGEGGSIDFDSDDGETVIETEDGSATISSGTDLPDGFPGDVPLPDDITIQVSQTFSEGGVEQFIVSGLVEGPVSDVTDAFIGRLEQAGFTQQQLTTAPDSSFFVYTNDMWEVAGTFFAEEAGQTFASVGVNSVQP
ncbi:MAG: hypothetical protein OEU32_05555 [Acidimicrobiia bacterium]|nr:hypothetical protein [Acidimicrobiia bacterium]